MGGSVRDALLIRPIHDVDIATSSYPERVKQIFHAQLISVLVWDRLVLDGDERYRSNTFEQRMSM